MHMQNYIKVAPASTLPDSSRKQQRKCSTPPKLDTIFEEDDTDVNVHKENIPYTNFDMALHFPFFLQMYGFLRWDFREFQFMYHFLCCKVVLTEHVI